MSFGTDQQPPLPPSRVHHTFNYFNTSTWLQAYVTKLGFIFYPGLSIPFNYIHINIWRYKTITNDKHIYSLKFGLWCSNKFSYVHKLITFLTSCGGFLPLSHWLHFYIGLLTYVTFIVAMIIHLRKFKNLLMKKWNLVCVWNLLLTTANNQMLPCLPTFHQTDCLLYW